jgi:hypothetical protein
VIAAAFDKEDYNCKIDGVICSGGLLELGSTFLPPKPVVKFMIFLSKYYPRVLMPATDFESTFDDALVDKDWVKTARADPKISMEIKATIGVLAATLSSGDMLRAKAKDLPLPFFAVHGKGDVRTSCAAMEEFVDNVGPGKASIDIIDTEGHQLLQDTPKVVKGIRQRSKISLSRP